MSETVLVPGFLPGRCALRFCNAFAPGPVLTVRLPGGRLLRVGDAAGGLCGGMVFAVRDYFEAGKSPPGDEEAPLWGAPLFHFLVRRLFDSFHLPSGPLKYFAWQALPDHDTWYGRGLLTRTGRTEWPRIRAELDCGRLSPLGFIRNRSANPLRIGESHQVMAYGYSRDRQTGEIVLRIYDPNHGPRDDLTMTFNAARPEAEGISFSTGERVRGFFRVPYRRPAFGSVELPG